MAHAGVSPPPPRWGVRPSSVVVTPGPWKDLLDFFAHRFQGVDAATWQARFVAQDIVDAQGQQAHAADPATPGRRLYYFRDVPHEVPIPFAEEVIWQDEHLVVADKPHFLPVVPSGKHVRETLLARLQRRLGVPHLSPIHRIDKDTAGLVLFSVQPASRNAYHALFRERKVQKTYECLAPWDAERHWPVHRESHIGPSAHFMQQAEQDGAVNAVTDIAPLHAFGGWAHYELRPLTGQRHQLRVHMHALGLPIVNDGIYPTLTPEGAQDFGQPLQLLARRVAFNDPITGAPRVWESRRALMPLSSLTHPPGHRDMGPAGGP
ncbi:MAG: pseudouridine synthase [Rhodoferax sp.]|nr:pseudouridine synthase [Rhodoferax sp.]